MFVFLKLRLGTNGKYSVESGVNGSMNVNPIPSVAEVVHVVHPLNGKCVRKRERERECVSIIKGDLWGK